MKKIILSAFCAIAALSMQAQTKTIQATDAQPKVANLPTAKSATIKKADAASSQTITTTKTEDINIAETHDFGKIPQGKPVTYDFVVTNSGKTPLKINTVQASCGCTTPSWDKDNAIAPGETGKITVGYNAQAVGQFTKNITINYNENQSKVIHIKGEVFQTPAASAPESKASELIKE